MKSVSFVLAACLSSASLVVAPRAHAEPPAYVARDVVMLKDGGMVRGNIRELVPNEYVVIDMQGGESRRFAMSEVHYAGTVEDAPGQPAPKAAPAPVRPATDEPTPPAEGVVRMHIDVDDPKVQLHRHEGTAAHWVPNRVVVTEVSTLICRAPCDQLVDGSKGEEFFFTGNGITPSSRFQLFDKRGDVSAEVKPGSSAGRIVGFVGAAAGAALVAAGAVSVLLGSKSSPSLEQVDGKFVVRETDDPGLKTAGYVMLGTGGAALVGGIWLWVANGTTFELRSSGGRPQQAASRQLPSWAFGRF